VAGSAGSHSISDVRLRRRKLAKPVTDRRLASSVIDDAEDARVCIDVGVCPCRKLRNAGDAHS